MPLRSAIPGLRYRQSLSPGRLWRQNGLLEEIAILPVAILDGLRQRNQILIAPPLLAQIARGLALGGTLSVMSDQPALYAQLLSLLPALPELRPLPTEAWSVTISDLIKSHYHRRWEERGRPILRVELLRV